MTDSLMELQPLLPTTLRDASWWSEISVRHHDLPARTTLYHAGTSPRRIYFVAEGWLASTIGVETHNRALNMLRLRGDVIGLNCSDGRSAIEDMVTVTRTQLFSVSSHDFRKHMRQHPEITDFIQNELARDAAFLQLMKLIIGRFTAPDRLAFFLFLILRRIRQSTSASIDTLTLPLTQDEIGQLLGLTNVSVNRAFRKLESEQLIKTGRQTVTFLDEARLSHKLHLDEWSDLYSQIVERRAGSATQ